MSPQGDLELLIEREFNAPSQLVFRLWERSDHMLRWWGPEKFTAIEMDWELTPGRAWRGAMTSQEYGLSRFSGVIREVEKNKRIVFTFRWDEESGRDPDSIVTVTVGDLMMTDVLRILDHTGIVDAYSQLSAYKQRCQVRPAFQRAMQAQREGFKKAA
jgi:uncharacterized protein YndB with AHSA1/START domain